MVVAVVIFYITFDTKDLVEGGMIKTCQAMVFRGRGLKMSVKSFRLKLPEYEQGNVK